MTLGFPALLGPLCLGWSRSSPSKLACAAISRGVHTQTLIPRSCILLPSLGTSPVLCHRLGTGQPQGGDPETGAAQDPRALGTPPGWPCVGGCKGHGSGSCSIYTADTLPGAPRGASLGSQASCASQLPPASHLLSQDVTVLGKQHSLSLRPRVGWGEAGPQVLTGPGSDPTSAEPRAGPITTLLCHQLYHATAQATPPTGCVGAAASPDQRHCCCAVLRGVQACTAVCELGWRQVQLTSPEWVPAALTAGPPQPGPPGDGVPGATPTLRMPQARFWGLAQPPRAGAAGRGAERLSPARKRASGTKTWLHSR